MVQFIIVMDMTNPTKLLLTSVTLGFLRSDYRSAGLRNVQQILIKKYVRVLFNQNNEERPRFFLNVGSGCSDMQDWKLILEILSSYCQTLHKTQPWLEKPCAVSNSLQTHSCRIRLIAFTH